MKLTPHLPIKYGFQNDKANNPPMVPSDAQAVGHFYKSFDARLWMFYRHWEPQDGTKVVATLMIVHGTVDHSGVYQDLATSLTKQGVAVIAMDMRGWGLSDGESMYFNDADTFVEDVHTLYARIHDTSPRYKDVQARFLMGKSLGGLVTAHAIKKYPTLWTGLIGLSGAYSLGPSMKVSPVKYAVIQLVAACCPKLPVKPLFDEHLIVADPQALQQWRDDKLCCKDRLRIGYAVEIMRAIRELPKNHNLNVSMLMMIGSEDQVVTREGHQLLLDLNASSDKELKVYPSGRHNLLQEPSLQESVTNDIVNWITTRATKTS